MSEAPEKQPQSKGPNVWAVGFAALFAGYLMGQYGASGTQQAASAAPSVAPITTAATTDMNAVDMNATDMNASDAALSEANNAVAAAGADVASAAADASTTDQPAYAYAPAPTAPTATGDSDTATVQVASSDNQSGDDTSAPTVPSAVASTVPAYQPSYSYSAPSSGYSGSSSNCVGTGCYGVISNVTGLPRTTYVHGYTRRDGTYVQPYYRSHRSH